MSRWSGIVDDRDIYVKYNHDKLNILDLEKQNLIHKDSINLSYLDAASNENPMTNEKCN